MKPQPPRLIRAAPDYPHWPAVAALLGDSFAYMEPLLGHPAAATALTTDDLARAATLGAVFLLIDDGAPVACLFTRRSRDFPDALYCGWLATDATHRGRGLAARLFHAAEAEARANGLAALTLDTGRALTDLHRVFARMGFAMLPGEGDVAQFRKPLARRLAPDDDFAPVHALLTDAFAYMQGRIDPPSSLNAMTVQTLRDMAQTREIWVIGTPAKPLACMVLAPRPDTLYLGKLATDPAHRGQGLARRLLAHAETRARALHLPSITLETRIELTENHATFTRLGFARTGETAHPGHDRPTSYTFVKQL